MAGIINIVLDMIAGYEILIGAIIIVVLYFGYTKWSEKRKKKKQETALKSMQQGVAPNMPTQTATPQNVFVPAMGGAIVDPPQPQQQVQQYYQPMAEQRPTINSSGLSEFEKFMMLEKEKDNSEIKDVIQEIKYINGIMKETSNSIDTTMKEDFERLKKQLQDVNSRKEQIKEYGLELSKLYQKHITREHHLLLMLNEMDNIIKKQQQQVPRRPNL